MVALARATHAPQGSLSRAIMQDPGAVLIKLSEGGEELVCPLVQLDARLEHKLKSLSKHHQICEGLREDIKHLQSQKRYIYFQMMNGRGIY
jgi:hypothetical protein